MRHDITLFDAPFFNISPHEAKVRESFQRVYNYSIILLIKYKVNGPSTKAYA